MAESKKSVSELQDGMIIAKDVISDEGIFLIPEGTTISKNHILKMQLYQISHAYVHASPEVAEAQPKDVLVGQTPEFKSFSSKYESQVHKLETELTNMLETGSFDHIGLSNIVNQLMSTSPTNSLFTYLCRIQAGDEYTYAHLLNVSIIAGIFAKWLHLDQTDVMNLSIAGLLHDIGKTQLNLTILNKKEKLTQEEFDHLKTHTTLGYNLIESFPLDFGIKQAVLLHHEKMNGSGYPLRPDWDSIHKYAKIIAIVDMYDAMTSDRPYHKRCHPFVAIRTLEEQSYGLLDTDYLFVFLENIAHHYLGNDVLLSTGETGKIIFINPQSPSRPMVQVKNDFIDLYTNEHITIKSFI